MVDCELRGEGFKAQSEHPLHIWTHICLVQLLLHYILGSSFGKTLVTLLGSSFDKTLVTLLGPSFGKTLGTPLDSIFGKTLGTLLGSSYGKTLVTPLGSTFGKALGTPLGSTFGKTLGTPLHMWIRNAPNPTGESDTWALQQFFKKTSGWCQQNICVMNAWARN